jgi:hypothetical protein
MTYRSFSLGGFSAMIYLEQMKFLSGIFFFTLLFAGIAYPGGNAIRVLQAAQDSNSILTPTPGSSTLQTPRETTTPDVSTSIGDTSGVVAIGMIVVVIILAGVLWGVLDLKSESRKNRQEKG